MDITELAASGAPWPYPVPSADGRILGTDGLGLPMPPQPHPYLARMARFTDGGDHASRRGDVLAVLATLPSRAGLERAARQVTMRRLPVSGSCDVVPLALSIPVAVLGSALGLGDLSSEIGDLVETGRVSDRLPDLASTSVLFQCRDAVAAVVLSALADFTPIEATFPVVLTRRAEDTWVLLDTGADPAPYGAGAHACPGREQAQALARGMVRALDGWHVIDRGPNSERVNLRIPTRLIMERA